jgi:RsiW-degrading membrane proteinase PrsW (M82 family)
MEIVFGFFLALIVPLLFLSIIHKFDFYQTGQFHIILKCLFWGGVIFAPATFTYWALKYFWLTNPDTITHFAAPIYEEIFKGLILLYLVKRAKFTYSVDGALYGFAIGTGFAIVENFFYIYLNLSDATEIAFQRIYSANLVHAFSSATVGITLGMFRSRISRLRWQIPAFGLLLAIGQHMLFNILIGRDEIYPLIFFIPVLPGILFIDIVMQRGKKQARTWIKEKLGMDNRVTWGEVAMVDQLESPNDVLYPVVERFGTEKARMVEKLLYLQARLGIKQKSLDSIQNNDPMRNAVDAEIIEMRTDMERIQREIGTYAMLFIRGLFTGEMISVWDQMQAKIQERSAETGGQKGGGLWSSLEERVKSPLENERVD